MSLSSSDSSGNESSPPRNFAKQQTEPIRKKKGAQSIDYHFTDAQERHLSTLMSSFEKQVNKLDPEWRGHCAPLTVWKKNTIHMLMQHELFRDLVKNGSLPQTKWFQIFQRKFSNHFNNTMKRKGRPTGTSTVTNISPVVSASAHATATTDNNKALQKVLRALIIFSGEAPARDLFAEDMAEELVGATQALRKADPTLPAGAARNKALKKLWDKADQNIWNEKAADLANDINLNQAEFPDLIRLALHRLCNRGRLGSSIVLFAYAYRNPEDDNLDAGIVTNGFDSYAKETIEHELGSGTLLQEWIDHAEIHVPRKPNITQFTFPRDTTGLPVFPDIDLKTGSFAQYIEVVKDYLTELWKFSFLSARNVPAIPWVDITTTPNKFYDTDKFVVPVALRDPEEYDDVVEIILLVKFFSRQTYDRSPFQFRRKEEIELFSISSLKATGTAKIDGASATVDADRNESHSQRRVSERGDGTDQAPSLRVVIVQGEPSSRAPPALLATTPLHAPQEVAPPNPLIAGTAHDNLGAAAVHVESSSPPALATTPLHALQVDLPPTSPGLGPATTTSSHVSITIGANTEPGVGVHSAPSKTRGRGRGRARGAGRGRGKLAAAVMPRELPEAMEATPAVGSTLVAASTRRSKDLPSNAPLLPAVQPTVSATTLDPTEAGNSGESRRSGRKRKAPTDVLRQALQPPAKKRLAKDRWEMILEPVPAK